MFASSRIREQLFTLEQGKCQKCGIDANALYLRIQSLQPAERLNALIHVNWYIPKGKKALDKLLQHPKEGDFWQADHIIPVAEGGGSCGLDNLRTLCTPCHQNETERLRFRLRLHGGPKTSALTSVSSSVSAKNEKEKKTNKRDLRDFFTSSSQSKVKSPSNKNNRSKKQRTYSPD